MHRITKREGNVRQTDVIISKTFVRAEEDILICVDL